MADLVKSIKKWQLNLVIPSSKLVFTCLYLVMKSFFWCSPNIFWWCFEKVSPLIKIVLLQHGNEPYWWSRSPLLVQEVTQKDETNLHFSRDPESQIPLFRPADPPSPHSGEKGLGRFVSIWTVKGFSPFSPFHWRWSSPAGKLVSFLLTPSKWLSYGMQMALLSHSWSSSTPFRLRRVWRNHPRWVQLKVITLFS